MNKIPISGIRPIVVKMSKNKNGNSLYTATCGSLRKVHKYDPSMSRLDNVRAAAALLCFDPSDRLVGCEGPTQRTWTFVHIAQ